ncbi:MAG: hypothetical protein NZ455_09420 [Bacteroidia bacterium]|nr:hypothetical protein [Bacteroidia bacterium]MDW8347073.1 hypothetical protein [Bacteroidia bacterium]
MILYTQFLKPHDWIYTAITVFVIYAIADWFKYKYYNAFEREYFFRALTIKLVSGISVGIIYQYFYGGGDTYIYHITTNDFYDIFIDYPDIGLEIFSGYPSEWYDMERYTFQHKRALAWPALYLPNEPKESAFLTSKYVFYVKLLTHKSYMAASCGVSFFSFIGMWLFYQVTLERYPEKKKFLFYAFFAIPSLCFWGSGILKDSITIGGVGFVVAGFYRLFILRKFKFIYVLWLIVGTKVMLDIKVYILLALILPLTLWFMLDLRTFIKNPILRRLSVPVLIIIGAAVGGYAVVTFSKKFGKFAVKNVLETAKATQYDLSEKGSAGGTSIKTNTYLALFNGLFRPLPFDVKNPFIGIASIENSLLLYLLIVVLRRNKFSYLVKQFGQDTFLLPALIFIILFGYMVGFSTPNLGALVRYKIPILPFYGILIALFYVNRVKKSKLQPNEA